MGLFQKARQLDTNAAPSKPSDPSGPSKPSDPSADPSPDPSPGKPNWFAKNRTALIIGVVGLFLIILIMLLR